MKTLAELAPIIRYAEAAMQQDRAETFKKGMAETVDKIASADALKDVSRALVEDSVIAHAFKDKSFDNAFRNREADPAGWDATLEEATNTLGEKLKDFSGARKTDAGNDAEPSIKDRINMSPAAWDRYIEDELAKAG